MYCRLSLLLVVGLAYPGVAAPPAETETPSADELARIVRPLLLSALPDPVLEKSFNWGKQKEVMNGITWEKKGVLLKPHKQEKEKNDGVWRKLRVEADHPDKTLNLVVVNVQKPEKGKVTFDMVVTMPVQITLDQQLWKSGVRLYSGETRASCRPILTVRCESTSKVEKSEGLLPDVAFRMRVLDARLTYDQFKVEHTAGVGGDIAKVLGDTAHDVLRQVRPSLEKNLLEKASKAIVKAGDTKEVKLGLGKLLDGK
jgi:hypothetical protein